MRIPEKLPLPIALNGGKHGPKLRALPSDRMQAFVLALLAQGTRNYTHAAIAAGYTGTEGALRVTAHRLAHDERIQAALHEEASRRLHGLVPLALRVVGDIMEDGGAKAADRLKAALSVMDRAGLHATTETRVTVALEDHAERLARIRVLAERNGIPLEKLLGARLARLQPPMIDAEVVGSSDGHMSDIDPTRG